MTDSVGAKVVFDSTCEEEGVQPLAVGGARDGGAALDRRHVGTILAFLRREVDQSSAILRDLAERLSDEFCALSRANDANDVQQRLFASSMALQNEDRVQQRLDDVRMALSILEHALNTGDPAIRADLDRAIIERLCLEETRGAFAVSVGLASPHLQSPGDVRKPSAGDVDLF